ncbi:FtsK/SpoIIIE domain-containing protein [Tuwongella immobilis]|uniref:FtsK domain-containing protein n=1 Tax=Tuwongella immobilis TaxID=692036 RepID=A0A6C2YHP8_9BACT|nr:FtsK/SpoIIIE domain-containing protein [Tuwongella immobilis]VIP00663.1 cell division protein : DNA segregation ATPase, FtsK/SpoIIIE family OS=Singulisphaera acidiphila (strain ATCC BAA-1392 / DSM 18658 / VKM B-2454 / MOB10) GN=Sinac_6281 PE=4 SV=1: FtsK_SpoIIIE [Tuwongella immobilis]VTR96744.1 cell division protein : DNA segregation ATPase, FtsK/SpoIIIE family OS=Singulisphaera acidiphila (strain ATCC BAA-1392 / DSM 18658 / VKM B-2454 / MOB10) GN=Sinac_6281 PE=4 SV=1: FtsK_SpoIIIE [Tuwongella
MSELLAERQRVALRDLTQLIAERSQLEQTLASNYENGRETAERDRNKAKKQLLERRESEIGEIDATFFARRDALAQRLKENLASFKARCTEALERVSDQAEEARENIQTRYDDKKWTIQSMREANERQADRDRDQGLRQLEKLRGQLDDLQAEAGEMLRHFRVSDPAARPKLPQDTEPPTRANLQAMIEEAQHILDVQWLRRGPWIMLKRMLGLGRGRIAGHGAAVLARVALGKRWCDQLVKETELEHDAARRRAVVQESQANQEARDKYEPALEQIDRNESMERARLEETLRTASESAQKEHDSALGKATAEYSIAHSTKTRELDELIAAAESICDRRLTLLRTERDNKWNAMAERWRSVFENLESTLADLFEARDASFPAWSELLDSKRPVPMSVPGGIPFGTLTLNWNLLKPKQPLDDRLPMPEDGPIRMPAFLPFPDRCSVLLKARDEGRTVAIQSLQSLMLRFLTALPPGKVRFTIIDPVGLGDNFAAFMHLADYDENLINGRIWTEPHQIEQRLTDLTAHMETVIQKYLRNQYRSIVEYNSHAGEVAEPFRVLVVANFPAQFTPEAARRLVSIVQTGGSCGVYTLLSVDTRSPLPQGFTLNDLEQLCTHLNWKDDGFAWKDNDLGNFPLKLETPPDDGMMTRLVQMVGERSLDANRVQVPFSFVAPRPEAEWHSDSRSGVMVALGRAGATKRQFMSLGKGTSQHVLVAGKTGSGKSTLLHALICNVALHYRPDEVVLYLIDFKKGVEFKPYAAFGLPHAQVVAIESEREFGLSVLQRLDAELRERGDRFRNLGVNDVASYREAAPNEPLPRILLIVDEFQEFFVADDRIAQDSALLLDRLVRQGRAFGLHVLLGSQTLGGAYTLARSTIDQMAVRIALQCSETDAQLILNKDNYAARLLSRPGEAIYNDAGGLIEGNDLFQVVWLEDDQREEILESIRAKADADPRYAHMRPLTFEGNAAAALEKNRQLAQLLDSATWTARQNRNEGATALAQAWLGEAIAIKDPTAAIFRRQSGSNLLLIGQDEESARSVLASAIVSIGLQQGPDARLFVFDGSNADDSQAMVLPQVTTALRPMATLVNRTALGTTFTELCDEVQRRLKGDSTDSAPRYLVIHGIQRFREVRKADDDYSFGRRGDRAASPGDQLVTLLRDGPPVGVHVLLWIDSLTNLNRTMDRSTLRDLGQRVLFQMSAGDSSNLVDSPIASRLGRNRALFTHDELEHPEKFRPYGPPSESWLAEVAAALARRCAIDSTP